MKNLKIQLLSVLFITAACTGQNQEETSLAVSQVQEQNTSISPTDYHNQKATDKLYVIEREMPGVGNLSPEELGNASKLSNNVLSDLGPEIKWIHSYVTGDKIYCVYSSPSEKLIKQHAENAGFPANVVSEAATIIDPTTGN